VSEFSSIQALSGKVVRACWICGAECRMKYMDMEFGEPIGECCIGGLVVADRALAQTAGIRRPSERDTGRF